MFIAWAFVLIGRPQDLIPALQSFRPALGLAIITLISVLLTTPPKRLSPLFKLGVTKSYLLLYLVMIAGIPFAYHRRVAFEFIFNLYLTNILFFMVFLLLIDSIKKIKIFFSVIALSAFFYSVFGLLKGSYTAGRFAIYGQTYDPNDIAYMLLTLFPLSFYYIINRDGALKRILAAAAVLCSIVVILLSGSRAGIIGLAVVLMLILFSSNLKFKMSYKAAFVICLVTVALIYGQRINTERYLTLMDMGSDYNLTDEFGRLQIWKRALQLLSSNPVTGVGVNCFSMALGYLRGDLAILPKWQAAHNSYIQIAVETGVIGFLIFITIIAGCFRNFFSSKSLAAQYADIQPAEKAQFQCMASLLSISFTGHLITAFFLSQGYSILFTLFFAFSGVLHRLTQSADSKKIALKKPRGLNYADDPSQALKNP
ncbi:MAG: O-antigen ligase family protein [Deltaproteobacteria bacterium]|nr:O-antigen ligase family protein [Deltaproteobacteria bacterium]